MSPTIHKSEFARALTALLDATEVFGRNEWAQLLGVTESAISQWVSDKTIPRPNNLHMIVSALERSSKTPRSVVNGFKAMARRHATSVSPHGKRMLPSVWDYMMRPASSELASRLAKLSSIQQEALLEQVYPEAASVDGGRSSGGIPQENLTAAGTVDVARTSGPVIDFSARVARADHVDLAAAVYGRSGTPSRDTSIAHFVHFVPPRFQPARGDNARESGVESAGWDQVAKSRHVFISGSAGVGKTAFLLRLADQVVQGGTDQVGVPAKTVPVYLSLRQMSSVEAGDEVWAAVPETVRTSADPRDVLLMLDGLDEVPADRRRAVAHAIAEFRERYSVVRLVVTSRPIRDVTELRTMVQWQMEPALDSQLLLWAFQRVTAALPKSDWNWADASLRFLSCLRERPDVFRAIQTPLLLSHAARLFARRSLTACHDADVLQACLTLLIEGWDEQKDLVRFPEAWGSPRQLYQWLSWLAYSSLVNRTTEFTSAQVQTWAMGQNQQVSLDRVLEALAELTGIVEFSGGERWRFAHNAFQEYLAACYVIEGSRDVSYYLGESLSEPTMARVVVFACGMASDATHLLRFVLTAEWPQVAAQMTTLADALAQQLRAATESVREACGILTVWLEDSFASWALESETDHEPSPVPEPRWRLAAHSREARRPGDPDTGQLLHVLRALHRARLSPTKHDLSNRLNASSNEIVRTLGGAMEIEGYLRGRSSPWSEADVLEAEILEV